MLTRLRCLLRIHRWRLETADDGCRYKVCSNCSKSKRVGAFATRHEDVSGYGHIYGGGGGAGG